MNYSRIALFSGFAAAALLAGCSGSSGKPDGKDWTRWTCDSKAVIEWRYIDGSKNIVDLRLKDEDDVVHHLEQEPAAVGAFYSDGRLGFHRERRRPGVLGRNRRPHRSRLQGALSRAGRGAAPRPLLARNLNRACPCGRLLNH